MSREIQNEMFFFLVCVSTGILTMFGYDLLRALRRVFSHGSLLLSLEDFLYWSIAGILAFGVIFMKNSGVLRGFSLVAMVAGMMLYHRSVSRVILRFISVILQFLTDIVIRMIRFFLFPFTFLVKKTKKLRKALKKMLKKVKMTLFKNRGSNSCYKLRNEE